jgi:hypothetical protein
VGSHDAHNRREETETFAACDSVELLGR